MTSFPRRIADLAAEHPDRTAVVFVSSDGAERHTTWSQLDAGVTNTAHLLHERGGRVGSMVVIDLPNCLEHLVATIAGWAIGALVLPVRHSLPGRERDELLDLADPVVVVTDQAEPDRTTVRPDEIATPNAAPRDRPPDVVSDPGKAIASGGSTGRPKIIVRPGPWAFDPGALPESVGAVTGFGSRQVQLVPGPLYHNTPFTWTHYGLFEDHTIVLLERFDAARFVDLVEKFGATFAAVVPTMMRRIVQLPDISERSLRGLTIFHTAAPCPAWVKRALIELLGAEHVFEGFGSTEDVGWIANRGDDWLEHPGCVGRPYKTELKILDEDGVELPAGEVGEIFMRSEQWSEVGYRYIGAEPATSTPDGFTSVGDLGWVDDQGYVYLADRRVDLIITGGANVYPAEVEGVLTEHSAVSDVAVIGVPDEEWGKRVHAVVQPVDAGAPPEVTELDAHCRERLTSYKVPKTYEFVDALPRDESGKIRRSGLATERESGWSDAMVRTT